MDRNKIVEVGQWIYPIELVGLYTGHFGTDRLQVIRRSNPGEAIQVRTPTGGTWHAQRSEWEVVRMRFNKEGHADDR